MDVNHDIRIEPIRDEHLDEAVSFLREGFHSKCSTEIWRQAFLRPWHPNKPNNGFLLRDRGRVVGAFGAIYSQQTVNGQIENFCNITSLYVLETYRTHSLAMIRIMLRQPGFHFTLFTANETSQRIFAYLKFQPLPRQVLAIANIAVPLAAICFGWRVLDKVNNIAAVLSNDRRTVCLDHIDCPNIRQVAIGNARDGYCHILFVRCRCKNLSCAHIYDVSDRALFRRFWPGIASYFLLRQRCLVTRVSAHLFEGRAPWLSAHLTDPPTTFFRSNTVDGQDIRSLYSELVALNGC